MSPCLSKYPFSNKSNMPPPTAPSAPPGLESPDFVTYQFFCRDIPLLILLSPISSYEQTTSIVPVFG